MDKGANRQAASHSNNCIQYICGDGNLLGWCCELVGLSGVFLSALTMLLYYATYSGSRRSFGKGSTSTSLDVTIGTTKSTMAGKFRPGSRGRLTKRTGMGGLSILIFSRDNTRLVNCN